MMNPEIKHVGHGSTHVRKPYVIPREQFSMLPELPPEYEGLRVEVNVSTPTEKSFALFETLGPEWAREGMSARDMVIAIQEYTGEMFNTVDVKNMLGWAEQLEAQAQGRPLPVLAPIPPQRPTELHVPVGTPEIIKHREPDGSEWYEHIPYEERQARKIGQKTLEETES